MELLALFALVLASGIGWLLCALVFPRTVVAEERFYFAPAIGTTFCGTVAYVAVRLHVPSLIYVFVGATLTAGVYAVATKRLRWQQPRPWHLARFSILALLCLYGMQIALYGLFSRWHPGPHEVWSLFNLTGTSPPDQMFAWHQAMFLDQHRSYPGDSFYGEMDLYDRPFLGGCITLFFFKLFSLPLTEHAFSYPAAALRFYHCLWWLLNNLYLLGVAPLFARLLGSRSAIFATASTALGGFFLLCNAGGWMKFSSAYPFLLAVLLFVDRRGPALQALLCAASYYLHGSVIPFLAGFGALYLATVRYPIAGPRIRARDAAIFASFGVVLVGVWFLVVRWVGSRQPLFYYYIYDAQLTEAQTRPVAEIARDFYGRTSWRELSLMPVHNLVKSFLPISLLQQIIGWVWANAPARVSDFASNIFSSQRFCIECALAVLAAPMVCAGAVKSLARKHAGVVALCAYLIPTLLIGLIYRKEWAFSLHVIVLYHTIVVFLWSETFRNARRRSLLVALTAIAAEGVVCALFADGRFLMVVGLRLNELSPQHFAWLAAYLALVATMIVAGYRELNRSEVDGVLPPAPSFRCAKTWLASGSKVLVALVLAAIVVGAYALYSRRYY